MILTDASEIELIRQAGAIAGQVLEELSKMVKPGISTWDLDQFAEQAIRDRGAIPTFKGYRDFPCTICASINEEVVHGIPSPKRVLKEGDVISMDIGATLRRNHNGGKQDFIGDTALTVPVGKISERLQKLLDDTRKSLYPGLPGRRQPG
jgi:methionyl aminopeptidase